MKELSTQQTQDVTGALILKRPPLTTLAIGEEGHVTTLALGEEGGGVTTKKLGEEGPIYTTLALGEEGGGPVLDTTSTSALGSF